MESEKLQIDNVFIGKKMQRKMIHLEKVKLTVQGKLYFPGQMKKMLENCYIVLYVHYC